MRHLIRVSFVYCERGSKSISDIIKHPGKFVYNASYMTQDMLYNFLRAAFISICAFLCLLFFTNFSFFCNSFRFENFGDDMDRIYSELRENRNNISLLKTSVSSLSIKLDRQNLRQLLKQMVFSASSPKSATRYFKYLPPVNFYLHFKASSFAENKNDFFNNSSIGIS